MDLQPNYDLLHPLDQKLVDELGIKTRMKFDELPSDKINLLLKRFKEWRNLENQIRKKKLNDFLNAQAKLKKNLKSQKTELVEIDYKSNNDLLNKLTCDKQDILLDLLNQKNLACLKENIGVQKINPKQMLTSYVDPLLINAINLICIGPLTKTSLIEYSLEQFLGNEYLEVLKKKFDILNQTESDLN
jgi:hypothetical protein